VNCATICKGHCIFSYCLLQEYVRIFFSGLRTMTRYWNYISIRLTVANCSRYRHIVHCQKIIFIACGLKWVVQFISNVYFFICIWVYQGKFHFNFMWGRADVRQNELVSKIWYSSYCQFVSKFKCVSLEIHEAGTMKNAVWFLVACYCWR
jgi:hypothetical protein